MVGGVSLGSPGTDGGLRAELSGGGGEGLLGVRLGAGVLFMMRARESWEVWQRMKGGYGRGEGIVAQ